MADQKNPGQQFNDHPQKSNEIITYLYNLSVSGLQNLRIEIKYFSSKQCDNEVIHHNNHIKDIYLRIYIII